MNIDTLASVLMTLFQLISVLFVIGFVAVLIRPVYTSALMVGSTLKRSEEDMEKATRAIDRL